MQDLVEGFSAIVVYSQKRPLRVLFARSGSLMTNVQLNVDNFHQLFTTDHTTKLLCKCLNGKCPNGKCLNGKCLNGKYPNDKCPRVILQSETVFFEEKLFRFPWFSGPTGSGKPGASILGESLDQEEPNDTSSMAIGPANPPTHL